MPPPQRPPRPALPPRDRLAILAALGGVTTLAWAYLAGLGSDIGSMMELRPWSGRDFALMFLMWSVMMVGMMVPTAAPMVLIYAAVARRAAPDRSFLAPTAVFVSGYVAMWTLFSFAATAAQWQLEGAALVSPMMVSTSPLLGAGLLVAAGIYQWTPIKDTCLRHCRAPAHFIAEHWRAGPWGALRMGVRHGAFCLGCCWVLMGLLFVGGVMNLLWVAAITAFVLLEKLLPVGARSGRLAGVALVALGGFMLWREVEL